ncbi:MAG: GAF domain-containing protein, partial [Firmicutes bacterium]|nr:GAF domain-containing protein [Bacillota bacterium]
VGDRRGFLALEFKDGELSAEDLSLGAVLADELCQAMLQLNQERNLHALEMLYQSNLRNSRVLNSTMSQEAICSLVAEQARALVRAEKGLFLLKDNKSGNCTLAGQSWSESDSPLNLNSFVGLGYLFGNQPMNIARPDRDPRLPDFLREFVLANDIRCILIAPIRYLDSIEGTLVLINRTEDTGVRFFTIEEEKVLTAFATQAALAISNCLMRQEMEKRVVEVTTLNSITNLIYTNLNMSEMLRMLVGIVAKTLRTKKCWISMVDDVGQNITTAASYGLSVEDKNHLHLGCNEGIAGWVVRNETPFLTANISRDPRVPALSRKLYREGSYLAVPIRIRNRVKGVLHIADKILGGAFTQEDQEWLVNLTNHVSVGLENAELYESLRTVNISIIRAMTAAIDAKDAYTRGHSERVSAFSVLIGEVMGLSTSMLEDLQFGGWLHDVGKIGIPEAILTKPESLDPSEYQVVCTHPVVGKNILVSVNPLASILPLVLYHHEWYNGNGYPSGLRGESIPVGARIMHVADALDAMTSNRAYRKAMEWQIALNQLVRFKGIQFDPEIVNTVLKIEKELEAKRYE